MDDLSEKCRKGEILCGECKMMLAEKIVKFLEVHQQKREEAKDKIDEFMMKASC
jgi:tryptophanyl-tRNA synthetase